MSGRAVARRSGDALTGLALAAGGAVFVVLAWPIPRGAVGNPGPGFLPLVLGLALTVLGGACAVRALREKDTTPVVLADRKAVICLLALAGAALAFIPLGFVPAVALFLAVLFRVLVPMAWWAAAASGLLASAALWLVFDKALGLGLPAGILPL
jgi:hypothetical protein